MVSLGKVVCGRSSLGIQIAERVIKHNFKADLEGHEIFPQVFPLFA